MSETTIYRDVWNLALTHLEEHEEITADDLHNLLPLYEGEKRVFGSVLSALRLEGRIRPNGYTRSTRAACHHRPIVKFQRVNP